MMRYSSYMYMYKLIFYVTIDIVVVVVDDDVDLFITSYSTILYLYSLLC
jgi:hypothetical protein